MSGPKEHALRRTYAYRPIRSEEGIEVFVVPRADTTLWDLCLSLEYRVFLESGYVETSQTERIADFDRYPCAEFLAAFEGNRQLPPERRTLSGAVRLIYAPQAREMRQGLFPTIDNAEELKIPPGNLKRALAVDPKRCFDIATMAVHRDKRDGAASKALISAIMMRVLEQPRLRYGFAAIDSPFYQKLKQRRLPFTDLGPSVMYMGSMSTAAMVDSFRVRGLQKLWIPVLKLLGYWRGRVAEGGGPR